jgi:hypothetical protein
MAESVPFDYDRFIFNRYDRDQMINLLEVRMDIANSIIIRSSQADVSWNPVEAAPVWTVEDTYIENMGIFSSIPNQRIILPKPSFNEILQMALDKQAPKQKELRAKARANQGAIIRVAA